MKPLVSVVVPTYCNEKILDRLLSSLVGQSYSRIQLIVVDNFSNDGTIEVAKKYTRYVYSIGPERSAQKNLGARKAKGEYVLFLDSDMELGKHVVRDCVAAITSQRKSVMIDEVFVGKGFWSQVKTLEKKCYTGTGEGEAARFFEKKLFKKIGGYDEALTGPEDLDLHKRMVQHTSFGRVRGIIHYDDRLSFMYLLKKRYYYSLSLKKYFRKHAQAQQREFNLIRPAFLKNWRFLAADPLHAFGFVILRVAEGVAVVLALLHSK